MAGRMSLRSVVAGLVIGCLLAGCSTTMRDVPVPGTGVGGDTIEVEARFDEALNLAEGAPVKVNGVDSGQVTAIAVEDFTAEVTMDVRTDARLHEGAVARLRYTTPLGELFVDVTNPQRGEPLTDGALLDLDQTATAPSVEDALAQASLLVNGGGLDQLQTITEELNQAIGGNEENVRTLLRRASTFLTEANATTASIDAVLRGLDSLSTTLGDRERLINRALREIRPAAAVLRRATPAFTRLLKAVESFSSVANGTVRATRTQLLSLLGQVEPVLAELAENRGRFPTMLRKVITGARAARDAIPADYMAIALDLHLDGIKAGNLPVLEDLLDLLDIVAPIGDVLDELGLGDLLGGLTGLTHQNGQQNGQQNQQQRDRDVTDPGRRPLSLDGLLGGLTGGG